MSAIHAFTPKKILLAKNRAIGDSLIGLAALGYLRERFPHAHISYATPHWIAPLYHNLQTPANEILSLKLTSLSDWYRTVRQIRQHRFDLIIDLHQSGSSQKLFWAATLGTQTRLGFHNHHRKDPTIIPDQGVAKPIIQRDLDAVAAILHHFGHPAPGALPHFLDYSPEKFCQLLVPPAPATAPCFIFGMVASRAPKMWPLQNFLKLADLIRARWPNCTLLVPLSNSAADQALKAQLPPTLSVVEQSLAELPTTMAPAQAYIGNDTGLKHLAVALNLPTLTLFGPEDPLEWHPYALTRHPYLYAENCSCRFQDQKHYCGRPLCRQHRCMEEFTAEQAWHQLQALVQISE